MIDIDIFLILNCLIYIHTFEKDDAVLVAHLSNDNSTAVILGKFYAGDDPKAELVVKNGKLTLKDSSGSISVAEIIAK